MENIQTAEVPKKHKGVSYAKWGYIFSIPFVVTFLIFSLYPILYTAFIGFTDLKGVGVRVMHVLPDPLANFKWAINAPTFRKAMGNTLIIWILNFIPQLGLALVLTAWFTNTRRKIKGQGAFKVLFYMPNIITAATIAALFLTFFGYPVGAVNGLLQQFGIIDKPIDLLRNQWTAKGVVAFIQFWMWYGNTMIVLIAGVMGISPTLFEAAEIDGATSVQTFFRVTLPSLRSIMLYTLITSLIGGLQMFDIPHFFNGAAVASQAVTTVSEFIYTLGFGNSYQYNRAAAVSMLMFVVAAALSAVLFYVMRDKDAALLKKQKREMRKQEALEARLAKEASAI